MRVVNVHLKSVSPYSPSRYIPERKPPEVSYEEWEIAVWRQRMHVNDAGMVYIPAMYLKNTVVEAAKYKDSQICCVSNRMTKAACVDAGIMVTEPVLLPIHADAVAYEELHAMGTPKRGCDRRVIRFPLIPAWEGVAEFHILDDMISNDAFNAYIADAGQFIGVGRFRPRNSGYYGRFSVEKTEWTTVS